MGDATSRSSTERRHFFEVVDHTFSELVAPEQSMPASAERASVLGSLRWPGISSVRSFTGAF